MKEEEEEKNMPRDITLYLIVSYFLFYLFYLLFLWLLRYKYPLLYCSFNPHSRILIAGSYLLYINAYIVLQTTNPLASRYHLFTYVALIALIVCLLFLKLKQIHRSPRFEFRHFNKADLQSFLNIIENEVKDKSPKINKSDPIEIGFMEHYFFYELNQVPFLYIEINNAGLLSDVNLEFYPIKEFDLISIHQLMKTLYQSYGKKIKAPYTRNRSLYFTLAACFIPLLLIVYTILFRYYPDNNSFFFYFILFPIPFLFLDVLIKADKKNFLNNQY